MPDSATIKFDVQKHTTIMTRVDNPTNDASVESVLEKIGPVKFDPQSDFAEPYDNDDKNEVWVRRRAVLLRNVFELYPADDAALACLKQYSELERRQPFLFLEAVDSLDSQEFEVTGLFRPEDFDNDEYYSDWLEAVALINKRHDARARRILAEYPELGLSE